MKRTSHCEVCHAPFETESLARRTCNRVCSGLLGRISERRSDIIDAFCNAKILPQMKDTELTQLAVAVIGQAIKDLYSSKAGDRKSAEEFLAGDPPGVEGEWLRRMLKEGGLYPPGPAISLDSLVFGVAISGTSCQTGGVPC